MSPEVVIDITFGLAATLISVLTLSTTVYFCRRQILLAAATPSLDSEAGTPHAATPAVRVDASPALAQPDARPTPSAPQHRFSSLLLGGGPPKCVDMELEAGEERLCFVEDITAFPIFDIPTPKTGVNRRYSELEWLLHASGASSRRGSIESMTFTRDDIDANLNYSPLDALTVAAPTRSGAETHDAARRPPRNPLR